MKTIKNLINISFIMALFSCTVSEKNWYEAASKLGGQSIYIKKDGSVSTRINRNISYSPKFNISDSQSADISYAAMQILYRKHSLEYKANPDYNSVYILDLRNGLKSFKEYDDIISKERKFLKKNDE